LHEAAKRGSFSQIQQLAGKELLDGVDRDGNTPLHLAIKAAKPRSVAALLHSGAALHVRDLSGHSPLVLALIQLRKGEEERCIDILRLLIAAGADVNQRSGDGEPPIHIAIREEMKKATLLLFEAGANLEATDARGRSALHIAAQWSPGSVPLLLDGGAKAAKTDRYGATPLEFAVQRGDFKSALMLTRVSKEALGRALELAILEKEEQLAFELMFLGGERSDGKEMPATTLHLAAQHTGSHHVGGHLAKGALVDEKDRFGATALCYAAMRGRVENAQMLLDAGGDVDHQNDMGDTPLHLAASEGKIEMVELLTKAGASLETKNSESLTPLALAISQRRAESALKLIELGASVNWRDRGVGSLLHIAAMHRLPSVFLALVEKGAPLRVAGGSGMTSHFLLTAFPHEGNGDLLQAMKRQDPASFAEARARLLQKELAHSLDYRGTLETRKTTSDKASKASLAGGRLPLWAPRIADRLERFGRQESLEAPSRFAEALRFLNKSRSGRELYQQWREKRLVLIQGGRPGHLVLFMLFENHLAICNRGSDSRAAAELYTFHPRKLQISHIEMMKKQPSRPAYRRVAFALLPGALRLRHSDRLPHCTLSRQRSGTCSMLSAQAALWSYLALTRCPPSTYGKYMLFERNELYQELKDRPGPFLHNTPLLKAAEQACKISSSSR